MKIGNTIKSLLFVSTLFAVQSCYADTLDCFYLKQDILKTRKQFTISMFLLIPTSLMGGFLMANSMRDPNAPPISKSTENLYNIIGLTVFDCFYIDLGYIINRSIKINRLEKKYNNNCLKLTYQNNNYYE
jgi:hypothetical protein